MLRSLIFSTLAFSLSATSGMGAASSISFAWLPGEEGEYTFTQNAPDGGTISPEQSYFGFGAIPGLTSNGTSWSYNNNTITPANYGDIVSAFSQGVNDLPEITYDSGNTITWANEMGSLATFTGGDIINDSIKSMPVLLFLCNQTSLNDNFQYSVISFKNSENDSLLTWGDMISGTTVELSLFNKTASDSLGLTYYADIVIGDVSPTTVQFVSASNSNIPEPTTATLSLLALAGMALRRRK